MPGLAELCTAENYIRSNWYSDTYRAEVEINGKYSVRDIQHISIPFNTAREKAYMSRFGLDREGMDRFYHGFGVNLKHGWKVEEKLKSASDMKIDLSSLYHDRATVIGKEDGRGSDIFIVYEKSEPFVGSSFIQPEGATLYNIITTAIRLMQTARSYSACGVHQNCFDLDSIYVTPSQDGKSFVRNAFFCAAAGEGGLPEPTPNIQRYSCPGIAGGEREADFSTDMYSVLSMIWAMLSGKHYGTVPDLDAKPDSISAGLADAMLDAMKKGESEYRKLNELLRKELGSKKDRYISFEPPAEGIIRYMPEEHYGDRFKAPEPEYYGDDIEVVDDRPAGTDRRRKLLAGAAIGLAAALTAFFSVPKIMSAINGRNAGISDYSANFGIYVLDDAVVDRDGQTCEGYLLDSGGNILKSDTGEICFRSGYASEYIRIEGMTIEITDRKFTTVPLLSDYGYRSDTVRLEDIRGAEYLGESGEIAVPADLNDRAGLYEGAVVTVRDDSGEHAAAVSGDGKDRGDGKVIYPLSAREPALTEIYNGSADQLQEAYDNEAEAETAGERFLGGEWEYSCVLTASPGDAVERKIRLSWDSTDVSVMADGQNIESGDILQIESGKADISIRSRTECSLVMTAEGAVCGQRTELAVDFPKGTRQPPQPAVIPTPRPVPTPQPTPTPTPTPAPVSYVPVYYPSWTGGTQETVSPQTGYSEPAAFTVSTTSMSLGIGESGTVVTSGDDGGMIMVSSSDYSVAGVDISNGMDGCYTITAVGYGTCTVTFTAGNQTRTVSVTVL